MARKSEALQKMRDQKRKRLLWIPLFVLFVKVLVIFRIQGFDWYEAGSGNVGAGLNLLLEGKFIPPNAWLGADGENYIEGLAGIVNDGLYSKEDKLSYWPAGYPILMFLVLSIFKSYFFLFLALIQSILYAVACGFMVDELYRTRIRNFALLIALLINFNPTLSLNSISVGYESPVVSLSLIAVALMLKNFRRNRSRFVNRESLLAAVCFSLASFMQPRLILIAIFFFLIWGLVQFRLRLALLFVVYTCLLSFVLPGALAVRNQVTHGHLAISTNLGVTMNLGAGSNATGGYGGGGGVDCPRADSESNTFVSDQVRVRCVVDWYLENPAKAMVLFWNKSRYFWSPWFGSEANGTMARNPWKINHPFNETIKTQEGANLVLGSFGKFTSWTWMISNLTFLFYGFFLLWKLGGEERIIGIVAVTFVGLNWMTSILTIGDHRFRIPSMGLSLLLQGIGFASLFIKKRNRFTGSSAKVEWQGVRWKASARTDNLPS